jgi:hypothetical protein
MTTLRSGNAPHPLTAEERARGGRNRAARIRKRKLEAERVAMDSLAASVGRAVSILADKLESDDERVQLRAAREILDRTLGRPTQAIAGDEETPVTIVVESVLGARERLAQKLASLSATPRDEKEHV